MTRYSRKKAAYLCCLYRADFKVPRGYEEVKFEGNKELNEMVVVRREASIRARASHYRMPAIGLLLYGIIKAQTISRNIKQRKDIPG